MILWRAIYFPFIGSEYNLSISSTLSINDAIKATNVVLAYCLCFPTNNVFATS